MLLEFKTKNYKSFKDELTFSMVAAPKQKGLDYSVQKKTIAGKTYKALSSAVIYGPNAAGKTNLIGAMDTMKSIVLRGHIRNSEMMVSPNPASNILELIPCCNQPAVPTMFSVKFIENGLVIYYTFTIMLGTFMDREYHRRILEESLSVNEKTVFFRKDGLQVNNVAVLNKYLNTAIRKNIAGAGEIAESSLAEDELFLTNGFKNIFAKELVYLITEWFDKKFMVIYRSDAVKTLRKYADPKNNTVYIEKTLTEAAREFGINSNALGYRVSENENDTVLCSIFEDQGKKVILPSEMFESYGTVRFINEFPLVINALLNGGTLVMDEFDASIHPMALMNIINIFHNDEINRNHAQLVFNTHNPIFLNSNLFRRDEIKFVERDETTHESTHYSLADFKTYGERAVRKGEDYMKNYFVSQYGAIKDIDFSSIFETIINGTEDIKNG